MAETTQPDPVLLQLTRLTQLIESQNARLETLERGNIGVTGKAVNAQPAGVGASSRSGDPPPGNDRGIGESTSQSHSAGQTGDYNALTSQQLVTLPRCVLS